MLPPQIPMSTIAKRIMILFSGNCRQQISDFVDRQGLFPFRSETCDSQLHPPKLIPEEGFWKEEKSVSPEMLVFQIVPRRNVSKTGGNCERTVLAHSWLVINGRNQVEIKGSGSLRSARITTRVEAVRISALTSRNRRRRSVL